MSVVSRDTLASFGRKLLPVCLAALTTFARIAWSPRSKKRSVLGSLQWLGLKNSALVLFPRSLDMHCDKLYFREPGFVPKKSRPAL